MSNIASVAAVEISGRTPKRKANTRRLLRLRVRAAQHAETIARKARSAWRRS